MPSLGANGAITRASLALDLVEAAQDQGEVVVGGQELTEEEAPAGGGRGVPWAGAFELAEQINLGPRSAAVGEVCLVFASLTSPRADAA